MDKKEKVIRIVLVVDKSGSMMGIAGVTVASINSFLDEQRTVEGAATVCLVLFSDRNKYQIVYDDVPVTDVPHLVAGDSYVPEGYTALHDAIGRIMTSKRETYAGDEVICVIVTDGMENDSKEYNSDTIAKLIEEYKGQGWRYVFLAANQDAVAVAGEMNISKDTAVTFSANVRGVANTAKMFSAKVSNYRKMSATGASTDMLAQSMMYSAEERSFAMGESELPTDVLAGAVPVDPPENVVVPVPPVDTQEQTDNGQQ